MSIHLLSHGNQKHILFINFVTFSPSSYVHSSKRSDLPRTLLADSITVSCFHEFELHLKLAHVNNAANALARVHVVEGLVDAAERLEVGDELVNLQLAGHVVVDQVGKLSAALDAAEGAALPHAAGDELECCEEVSICTESSRRFFSLEKDLRRVAISWPAAATPMMMLSPQPLWQASSALRMTCTLPVQSKV